MATFKHTETGKRFHFIHIPRTGGRFIEVNLKNNGWEAEPIEAYGISHYQHSFIEDCEIAHFHRELYEKYCDIEGIPQIAVVRNPIDKFFSASIYMTQVYGPQIMTQVEDEEKFFYMLENFPFPETLNWWRSQVEFLSEDTHIWKYEDGLGPKFSKWVSEIVGVPFKTDAFAQYEMSPKEGTTKLDKSGKLIDNVRKLCRRDIEQLYPELDTSLQEREKAKA